MNEIAWNYGTSVWRQRLVLDGPGWSFVRQIQDGRPHDAARRDRAAERVAHLEVPRPGTEMSVRLVAPDRTDDGAVYRLSTCEVLSGHIWPELRIVGKSLESVMTGLGAAVARMHSSSGLSAGLEGVTSPHLLRLREHLDAPSMTWAGQAIAHLRPAVVGHLRRWLDELPSGGALCHGGFALGSVFVDQDVSRVEVLAGEELMLSIPELDLGWMLGELTEHEFHAVMRGRDGLVYEGAGTWLVEGWTSVTGEEPDRRWIDKVIALRSFLRMCDVAETTQSAEAAEKTSLFMNYLVERVGFLDQVPTQRPHSVTA